MPSFFLCARYLPPGDPPDNEKFEAYVVGRLIAAVFRGIARGGPRRLTAQNLFEGASVPLGMKCRYNMYGIFCKFHVSYFEQSYTYFTC